MKKKHVNLKQLSLKRSKVASLESQQATGGYQSWTGTYEPCSFTDFDCQTVYNCPPPPPPHTQQAGCTATFNPPCGGGYPTDDCPSHSVCPPGVYCY
jgi:hypothetical protein